MSSAETNRVLPDGASAESKRRVTLEDEKQEKASTIELKNGKVVCKQKCVSFEKQSESLQEIVKFREMLEARIESQQPPLKDIPEAHRPLIAKLAHESDKALAPLAKHMRQGLLPVQDEEGDSDKVEKASAALPLAVVEAAIRSILNRNNYGLDVPIGIKVPASLSVWRWEVKDEHKDWLPKNGKEKAEQRLAERIQAKQTLNATFQSLPQSERDAIFNMKGASNKLPVKELNRPDSTTPGPSENPEPSRSDSAKTPPSMSKKVGKQNTDDVENDATDANSKIAKAKKAVDPEKAAKEKERLEKRAAKAEKEKKEKDAQDKSRSIMASFFAKPKASAVSRPVTKEMDTAVAGPSKIQSEFKKTFKPFVLKKDAALAPTNWFKESKLRKRRQPPMSNAAELIIIDNDDIEVEIEDTEMQDIQTLENDLAKLSTQERLRNILSSLPPSADPSWLRSQCRKSFPRGFKTYNPTSVRDVLNQLSEAEIVGDDVVVRQLLSKLRDRTAFPAKAFIFADDARPGYFGTWTRSSRIIGPRTPFAKDVLVFDYGYDSGEEWEEEPAGDADDVAEDGDDDDEAEDPDSDLDSWLVDDDEESEVGIDPMDPPDIFDLPPLPPKRKAGEDGEKKLGKKRKVVVPLVPFAKGPCWEGSIGHCSYEPLKPYRIQLFNDTPFPIDPFTFVSTCVEDHRNSLKATTSATTTNDGFAIPPLPPRLTVVNNVSSSLATNGSIPSTQSAQLQTATVIPKKTPIPKTPFPDAHVPFLMEKITQLETGSFVLLVEFIYEALKANKVTKAAVEAKIREVGEKCKVKKKWTVKPALLATMAQTQTA